MYKFTKKQRFSHPILGGLVSALLFAFLWRIVADFATIVAIVPLFVLSLMAKDIKTLLPALGIGLLNVAFLLGPEQILNYALYVAAPGLVFPQIAMQFKEKASKKSWYPLDRLSGALALYAIGAALFLTFPWHMMDMGDTAFQALQSNFAKNPIEFQDRFNVIMRYVKILWPYVPGVSMGFFILMMAFSTSITQKWFKRNKVKFPRPALKLSDIYLPWWCWKVFALTGVAWALFLQTDMVFLQYIFGNITLPLVFAFILQGLSIVTTFAKKQKNPKMILVIFYGFVVLFGWTLLILILAGLLEPWLDLRARLIQKKEKE